MSTVTTGAAALQHCQSLHCILQEAKTFSDEILKDKPLEQELHTFNLGIHVDFLNSLLNQLNDSNLFRNESFLRKGKENTHLRQAELERLADDLRILQPRLASHISSAVIVDWEERCNHLLTVIIPEIHSKLDKELKYYTPTSTTSSQPLQGDTPDNFLPRLQLQLKSNENASDSTEMHVQEQGQLLESMIHLLGEHEKLLGEHCESEKQQFKAENYQKFLTPKNGSAILSMIPENLDFLMDDLDVSQITSEEDAWKIFEALLLALKYVENKFLHKTLSSKQLKLYSVRIGVRLQQLNDFPTASESATFKTLIAFMKSKNQEMSAKCGASLIRQESIISLTGFETTVPKIKQEMEDVIGTYVNSLLLPEGSVETNEKRTALILLAEKYCSRLATMTQRNKAPTEKDSDDELLENPNDEDNYHRMQWKDMWIAATEYSENHHHVLADEVQLKTALCSLQNYCTMLSEWMKLNVLEASNVEALDQELHESQIHQQNLFDQLRIIDILLMKVSGEALADANKALKTIKMQCWQVLRGLVARTLDLQTATTLLKDFQEKATVSVNANDCSLQQLFAIKAQTLLAKKQAVLELPSFEFTYLRQQIAQRLTAVQQSIEKVMETERSQWTQANNEETSEGALQQAWNVVHATAFDIQVLTTEEQASAAEAYELSNQELKAKRTRLEAHARILKRLNETVQTGLTGSGGAQVQEGLRQTMKLFLSSVHQSSEKVTQMLANLTKAETHRPHQLQAEAYVNSLKRQAGFCQLILSSTANYPEVTVPLQEERKRSDKLLASQPSVNVMLHANKTHLQRQLGDLRTLLTRCGQQVDRHIQVQQRLDSIHSQLLSHLRDIEQFEKNLLDRSLSEYLEFEHFYKFGTIRLAEQRLLLQRRVKEFKKEAPHCNWEPLKSLLRSCDAKMAVQKDLYDLAVQDAAKLQQDQSHLAGQRLQLEKSVTALRTEYQKIRTFLRSINDKEHFTMVTQFLFHLVNIQQQLFEVKKLLHRDDVSVSLSSDDANNTQKSVLQVHCQLKHLLRRKVKNHIQNLIDNRQSEQLIKEWTSFSQFWLHEVESIQLGAEPDYVYGKIFAFKEMSSVWEQYLFYHLTLCPGLVSKQTDLLADWSALKDTMEKLNNLFESKRLSHYHRDSAHDLLQQSLDRVGKHLSLVDISPAKPLSQQKFFTVFHLTDLLLKDAQTQNPFVSTWLQLEDNRNQEAAEQWNNSLGLLWERYQHIWEVKQYLKQYANLCITLDDQFHVGNNHFPELRSPNFTLSHKRLTLQIIAQAFAPFPNISDVPLELSKVDRLVMKARVNILAQTHLLFEKLINIWTSRIHHGFGQIHTCLTAHVLLKHDLGEIVNRAQETVISSLDFEEAKTKVNNWLALLADARPFADKNLSNKLVVLQKKVMRLLRLVKDIHEKKLLLESVVDHSGNPLKPNELELIFQEAKSTVSVVEQ